MSAPKQKLQEHTAAFGSEQSRKGEQSFRFLSLSAEHEDETSQRMSPVATETLGSI